MSDEEVAAVTEAPKVTRPARTKSAASRRAEVAKPAEPKSAEVEVPTGIRLTLEPTGESKNYVVFEIPRSVDGQASQVIGKLYAPKGATTIKILVL